MADIYLIWGSDNKFYYNEPIERTDVIWADSEDEALDEAAILSLELIEDSPAIVAAIEDDVQYFCDCENIIYGFNSPQEQKIRDFLIHKDMCFNAWKLDKKKTGTMSVVELEIELNHLGKDPFLIKYISWSEN